jgi:hypothetical protein
VPCLSLSLSLSLSLCPELELALDRALVRLHAAQAHALHVLHDAQRSVADFELRLLARKARLRALGFPLP